MRKTKLKIGVIGLGRIGWQFHCATLAKHAEFKLIGVADPERDRRAEAEHEYGCAAFADYRHLLKMNGLQAVAIAAPTHLHRPMASAALHHGLHVMLEKPMAATVRDGEYIARTARACHRRLTVYQPHRVAAYFQHVRRLIATGKIGTVYHVRRGLFGFSRRNDWQSLQKYGGGMLNNYGAHALDQVLQLVGYDVRRVFCNLRRVASLGDAEDVVKIVIETKQGLIGEVDINQACAQSLYDLEVIGTTGVITLQTGQSNVLHVRRFSKAALKPKRLDRKLASANRQYPSDQIAFKEETIPVNKQFAVDVYRDFARAIRTGTVPFVDPRETLALMRIMAQCRCDAERIRFTPL
ncbi:MAG: Gfo/Idh/MocA family oxidoreductase [Verrucomicrobia bacterium]|nr:Gfo/Idh/MocA family oxidoreductase [Verrucomicrobiota bacterium]